MPTRAGLKLRRLNPPVPADCISRPAWKTSIGEEVAQHPGGTERLVGQPTSQTREDAPPSPPRSESPTVLRSPTARVLPGQIRLQSKFYPPSVAKTSSDLTRFIKLPLSAILTKFGLVDKRDHSGANFPNPTERAGSRRTACFSDRRKRWERSGRINKGSSSALFICFGPMSAVATWKGMTGLGQKPAFSSKVVLHVLLVMFLGGNYFFRQYQKNASLAADIQKALSPITAGKGLILALPAIEPDKYGRDKYAGAFTIIGKVSSVQLRDALLRNTTYPVSEALGFHMLRIDKTLQSHTVFNVVRTISAVYVPSDKEPMWAVYMKPCSPNHAVWDQLQGVLRSRIYSNGMYSFTPLGYWKDQILSPFICNLCELDDHLSFACPLKDTWGPRDVITPATKGILELPTRQGRGNGGGRPSKGKKAETNTQGEASALRRSSSRVASRSVELEREDIQEDEHEGMQGGRKEGEALQMGEETSGQRHLRSRRAKSSLPALHTSPSDAAPSNAKRKLTSAAVAPTPKPKRRKAGDPLAGWAIELVPGDKTTAVTPREYAQKEPEEFAAQYPQYVKFL
ncbi:hypothetical protein B0H13DRAFT_1852324 [Mycena leptocephala]|nr:hypothetical protein B0H13DRAFT_1852324 [Mycena leptocephala]